VIGHATFCVVVVYNNVLARLRRTSGSFFEASPTSARRVPDVPLVTLPTVGTGPRRGGPARVRALVGRDRGHVLHGGGREHAAAALFGFIRQGQNLPIVNAIALVVIVVSAIPVWIAQRLTSGSGGSGPGRRRLTASGVSRRYRAAVVTPPDSTHAGRTKWQV
jgi:putative spermidine/putrescine transport system permease protein